MYRKRWKKASRWWKDNVFSPPFSGSGRWKNTWSEKRRKKRAAWQAAFDYLPDLDVYDTLSSALPLIGFSSREVTQSRQLTHNDGSCNSCLCIDCVTSSVCLTAALVPLASLIQPVVCLIICSASYAFVYMVLS